MVSSSVAWRCLEICVVVLSCCSLALYASVVVRWLARVDGRSFSHASEMRTMARGVWSRCTAACSTGCKDDGSAIFAAAYKLFQDRRREMCRSGIYVTSPILAMGAVLSVCHGTGLLQVEDRIRLGESHAIIFAMAPSFVALCAWRPEQPTKRVVVPFQVIGFMSLMWTCYCYKTGLDMLFDRSTCLGFRLAFAMMLCDLRLTLALNSMYSAVAMYQLVLFASTDEGIAQLPVRWFVLPELGALVMCAGAHVTLSWRMENEARTTIESKASINFVSGLSKLLKKSYNAVIELSDDLKLTSESEDLAGLLLFGPHRSLQGTSFVDLMAFDVDKEAFTTHAMQPTCESQCCVVPHIFRMRDSDSNLLRLEIFHTKFEDLESRARHLIGIIETELDEEMSPPRRRPSRISSLGRAPSIVETRPNPQASPRLNREEGNSDAPTGEGPHSGTVSRRRSKGGPSVRDAVQPRQGHIERPRDEVNTSHDAGLTDSSLISPPQQIIGARRVDRESDIEDSDSASSSSSAPLSGRSDSVSVEGFRPTTPHAQRTLLLSSLAQWHVSVRAARCCTYHAVVGEAKHVVKAIGHAQCNDFHRPHMIWQCPGSGILEVSAEDAGFDPVMRTCTLCKPIPSSIAL